MKPATILLFALCLAVGLLHIQSAAAQGQREPAQPTTRKASTTFVMHGYKGLNPDAGFGALKAEFEKRGFPCIIVVSPHTQTKTPNQDRARDVVDALRDVKGDVALLGVSNQGLFLPLVAAARPVRRIVVELLTELLRPRWAGNGPDARQSDEATQGVRVVEER